jgi:hypothetical protein
VLISRCRRPAAVPAVEAASPDYLEFCIIDR